MKHTPVQLVDFQHPVVRKAAHRLTAGKTSDEQKVEAIFYFVRDHISYMLLPGGDWVTASEIISTSQGQCNNKNVAFLALCKAADIPARIHFGLIIKDILRGLVSERIYKRLPATMSHSWIEVQLETAEHKEWKRIDTHILDDAYFQASKKKIEELGWDMGYAVANISVHNFILHDTLIPHTPIIPEEHGSYEYPEEYFNSNRYANKLNWFTALAYRLCMNKINRQLDAVRNQV